jgi:hypothetical protein
LVAATVHRPLTRVVACLDYRHGEKRSLPLIPLLVFDVLHPLVAERRQVGAVGPSGGVKLLGGYTAKDAHFEQLANVLC